MGSKNSDTYVRYVLEDLLGWKWLDDNYFSNKQLLSCVCNNGHFIKIAFNKIYRGCRCCNKEKKDELIRINNYLKAKTIVENKNWIMLSPESDYKEYSSKLKIRSDCEFCHEFKTSYACLKSDISCPLCKKSKKIK